MVYRSLYSDKVTRLIELYRAQVFLSTGFLAGLSVTVRPGYLPIVDSLYHSADHFIGSDCLCDEYPSPRYQTRWLFRRLFSHRCCFRSSVPGISRDHRRIGLFARWLLLEHVATGAEARWPSPRNQRQGCLYFCFYGCCLCDVFQPLHETVRTNWFNIVWRSHSHYSWDRLF